MILHPTNYCVLWLIKKPEHQSTCGLGHVLSKAWTTPCIQIKSEMRPHAFHASDLNSSIDRKSRFTPVYALGANQITAYSRFSNKMKPMLGLTGTKWDTLVECLKSY